MFIDEYYNVGGFLIIDQLIPHEAGIARLSNYWVNGNYGIFLLPCLKGLQNVMAVLSTAVSFTSVSAPYWGDC